MGGGGAVRLCMSFKHATKTKSCSWERVRESRETRGAERCEEQEVDEKVIAVSTWSSA